MNKQLHNCFLMLMLSALLIPITGNAYNQIYNVKVGETFTVYTTYHSNTTAILWTIPYDFVEPVGYVGPTATSVTFKAIKATSSGVIIQAVTRANYRRVGVDDWLVRITDSGGGNGGGGNDYPVSLPSLSANPSGGQIEMGTIVKLYANGKGADWSYDDVRYTLDGNDPKYGYGIQYSYKGIEINESCTLRAVGKKWNGSGYEYSSELKEIYTVKEPVLVTGFNITNSTVLSIGESVELIASNFEPSNSSNHNVKWSISNSEVATIQTTYSNWCVVTGISAGTATITCTAADGGGASTTCEITVIDGVFSHNTVEGIEVTYRIVSEDNKTCEVGTGLEAKKAISTATSSGTTMTIPENVNGYRVIGISDYAFDSRFGGSTKVILPNSISYIGNRAFSNSSLTDINMPSSLVSIGAVAFGDCKIKGIKIPDNVESIGQFAFVNCKEMTSAEISGSVKRLEKYSFAQCDKLTSIILHDGVSFIDKDAFRKSPLKDVTVYSQKPIRSAGISTTTDRRLFVPKGVKEYYGNKNDVYRFIIADISNIFEMEDVEVHLLSAPNSDGYDLVYDVIDETQKTCELYDIPFSYNKTLSIPETVNGYMIKSIGYRARTSINNWLEELVIPNGITSIGDYAFEFLDKLSKIVTMVDDPFEIADNVFNMKVYENSTLYVPLGTKSKYESTIGWSYFKNIAELDPSGIDCIPYTKEQSAQIFDLFGRKLGKPQKGINIIGGKKVILK